MVKFNSELVNARQGREDLSVTTRCLLVISTCPDGASADAIAAALVEGGQAACVNIVPGMTSVYRWQGQIERDSELLVLAKTTSEAYPQVEEVVRRWNPNDVPEIIAVPVERGLTDYLDWVFQQTAQED